MSSREEAEHCFSLHNPLLKIEETFYSETCYLSTRVRSVNKLQGHIMNTPTVKTRKLT
jgi:hypothetical protein